MFSGEVGRCITGEMAFNPPNPDSEQRRPDSGKDSGGLASLVQAEKLMQIAFLLPCATLIGYGLGWWIDHHFGTHWATIAGLVLGLVAGMVGVIRMALAAGNTPTSRGSR
jgi:ATP synthase protein I